jgi:hypothetical protein
MVRPEGFEPPTLWFVAKCSIQLSYGRTLRGMQPFKDIGVWASEQAARHNVERGGIVMLLKPPRTLIACGARVLHYQ